MAIPSYAKSLPPASPEPKAKWGVGIATACIAGFDAIPMCASIGAVAGYAFPLALDDPGL